MEDTLKSREKNTLLKKMLLSLTFSKAGRTKSSAKTTGKDDQRRKTKQQVTSDGCFSVCVGPKKQKFAIKIEYANHPLFKMLLEDAELEYGFSTEGPILLPCTVEFFLEVLAEMDRGKEIDYGCGFAYASCSPFNPARRLGRNSDMAEGYGSYGPLTCPIHDYLHY